MSALIAALLASLAARASAYHEPAEPDQSDELEVIELGPGDEPEVIELGPGDELEVIELGQDDELPQGFDLGRDLNAGRPKNTTVIEFVEAPAQLDAPRGGHGGPLDRAAPLDGRTIERGVDVPGGPALAPGSLVRLPGSFPDEGQGEGPWGQLASRLVDPGLGEVELRGARWRRLLPAEPVVPGPMLVRREVRLRPAEGGVQVWARYWLQAPREGWFANQLLGPTAHLRGVTVDGRDATVWSGGQGPLWVERIDGAATVTVEAFVPGQVRGGLTFGLMGAPRGAVVLEGFGEQIELWGDERPVVERDGARWTGASELRLAPRVPQPRDRGPLAVARVGLGVTVGDAEIRGRGRLRWEIRQGTRTAVSFTVAGVGEDLSVEGPLVGRWERHGDRVQVVLTGPTTGRVELDVRWSIATPRGAEARVPLPALVPDDVFRSVAAVQVARDGEVDVKPALARPFRPVARAQLPAFAEGLVEGSPTAAFVRPRAEATDDALELLRLEPVPGPPMVVDVADVHVATTTEGRVLMRARYEIRNERAAHLSVTPPPGLRLVGVEVAGRPVNAARDGAALQIPIKRSVETLRGLVTVPVTVALVGEDQSWTRRERRSLPIPAVDAPVSVCRVSVHLPPRYRNRLDAGTYGVVDRFTRGQGVAHGLVDEDRVATADRLFADAIDAWNANEFERAQLRLDELAQLSAYGANAEGLQANVDLVRPRPVPPAPVAESYEWYESDDGVTVYSFEDETLDAELLQPEGASIPSPAKAAPVAQSAESGAVARRIRARLRARSGKKKAEFERRKRKAKMLKDEGRYDEAAAEYRQAIEDSRDLEVLEDEESVEYDYEAEELTEELRSFERASDRSIRKIIADDGEFDLVSGSWVRVASDDGAREPTQGEPERAWSWTHGPLVRVPAVGSTVRYQHLLLEAGEQRTMKIDAVRRWRRR
ncbi:MAG: hypothetical protein AAGF11_45040 [Myxococcota bacterium]